MFVLDLPEPVAPAWARLQRVGEGRWRLSHGSGLVIGHLSVRATDSGWRFAAERFDARARAFRRVGEFWSSDEALECLRLSR
ncbi:hypothetical protein ACIQLJ_06920 [Microbacterium sp. NPDC091313]